MNYAPPNLKTAVLGLKAKYNNDGAAHMFAWLPLPQLPQWFLLVALGNGFSEVIVTSYSSLRSACLKKHQWMTPQWFSIVPRVSIWREIVLATYSETLLAASVLAIWFTIAVLLSRHTTDVAAIRKKWFSCFPPSSKLFRKSSFFSAKNSLICDSSTIYCCCLQFSWCVKSRQVDAESLSCRSKVSCVPVNSTHLKLLPFSHINLCVLCLGRHCRDPVHRFAYFVRAWLHACSGLKSHVSLFAQCYVTINRVVIFSKVLSLGTSRKKIARQPWCSRAVFADIASLFFSETGVEMSPPTLLLSPLFTSHLRRWPVCS